MATTTANQSATFKDIATAIVAQLVSVTGVDSAYIRTVASDDYKLAVIDDHMLYVRYYGLKPATDYGAGRRVRRVSRLVRVYIYSRSSLDTVGEDTIALLGDGGHSDLEESCLNSLDDFFPADSDGNPLTVEPLHPLPTEDGPPERRAEDDVGIVRSSLLFECQYVLVNETPQP